MIVGWFFTPVVGLIVVVLGEITFGCIIWCFALYVFCLCACGCFVLGWVWDVLLWVG